MSSLSINRDYLLIRMTGVANQNPLPEKYPVAKDGLSNEKKTKCFKNSLSICSRFKAEV